MDDKKIKNMIERLDPPCKNSRTPVYEKVISDVEKTLIRKALKRAFGNQSLASKILGINRNTLRKKIIKLKINVKSYKI